MADFKTHTLVATVISGGLGIGALVTGLASPADAFCYWLAGSLGGLLPDIDSDESLALRIVFRLFGALVAGLLAFYWMTTLPAWQAPRVHGATGVNVQRRSSRSSAASP
jgi:hypothetical protein